MTTNTTTIDRTKHKSPQAQQSTRTFSGDLYRFHGFTVVDSNGKRVGIVDWVWTNDVTGEGDHIGLQLQWLRGKARAVPATGARVDRECALVRLPFTKREVGSAPRFRIDRALSNNQQIAIKAHFTPSAIETRSASRPSYLAA